MSAPHESVVEAMPSPLQLQQEVGHAMFMALDVTCMHTLADHSVHEPVAACASPPTTGAKLGVDLIKAMRHAAFVIGTSHRVRHANQIRRGDRPHRASGRRREETTQSGQIWALMTCQASLGSACASCSPQQLGDLVAQPSQRDRKERGRFRRQTLPPLPPGGGA